MSAPVPVAWFRDAPDSVIANAVRDLAWSGHVVLDVTLLEDFADVVRLVRS